MTHDIDLDEHYVSGDSLTIVYTVVSDDIESLSGVSASWWLLDDQPDDAYADSDLDADALLSDDAAGVSLRVLEQESEIELEFDEGATGDVNGYLYQILRAEGEQGQQTWSGRFPIRRP